MTDHTPEPWQTQEMPSETYCRERGDWIMLSGPDWFRAQACVNACAGIPTEQLGSANFKQLIDNAEAVYLNYDGDAFANHKTHPLHWLAAALAPFRKD